MSQVNLLMLAWLAGSTAITWLTPRRFQPAALVLIGAVFLLAY